MTIETAHHVGAFPMTVAASARKPTPPKQHPIPEWHRRLRPGATPRQHLEAWAAFNIERDRLIKDGKLPAPKGG